MSMEVQQFLNDTGGNFTEMAPRPPVPGEETAELQSNGGISTRSSGSHKSHLSGKSHSSGKSASSHRSDVSHSPAATPRRSNLDKTITCTSVGYSEVKSSYDEDAPLGFEPEGSAANSPQFTENSTPPYLKWAESIKFLLDDSDGVKLFKQFLDQDTCSNLLDFWFACKGLKMVDEGDTDRIHRVSKLIYKKYIKGDQLTLRVDIRKSIVDRLKNEVHQNIFDPAQNEVEIMMKNDAYPQFLKSDIYLQYVQTGGESPKTSNNSSGSSSARPLSGPLPTLHEGEELSTDDIKRSSAPALPLTQAALFNTRRARESSTSSVLNKERTVNNSMFAPSSSRLPNPYHVSYTTVSAQDSELQSLSSDALTDDTMSLTDSSVDGRDLPVYGKKAWKKQQKAIRRYADANKQTQLSQQLIPRTERAPKDRNLAEKEPGKFAAILKEKLLKVKEEQDKLDRIKENLQNLETDEESDSTMMGPPTSIPPKANPPPPPPTNPLNMLLALANKDSEDNAQSILEEHCSRVWDNSNGQTPSRSPGRHSPKSWAQDPNNSIRYPYAPGPSPNVSGTSLFPTPHNKSHTRRKDKDINALLTTSSYDSGTGTDDKSGASLKETDMHHKSYVYHHHHHHHHVMKDGAQQKSRTNTDADSYSNRNLHYHLSAPTLPNFSDSYGSSHRTQNSHNHSSTWDDTSRTPRPKESKRATAKKGLDSSSNIDSGVGLPSSTEANPASVPNINDPANEKVIAWMLENDKLSTGNTQYSTDGSDKTSSQKRSSHKSNTSSQHKSVSSSGKKSQPQTNANRSGSLDRSGFNSFHQPVGGDYSWSLEGAVQPSQPFAQDSSMPLLNPPNSMTQLEEVKRRLEDESSKARMRQSKSFTGASSSSSSSRDRRTMPPPTHSVPPQRTANTSFAKNIPQVAPLDLSSSEEHSSSHGSHKSESRRSVKKMSSVPTTPAQSGESTVIGYYFCNEPIPYRTSLPGKLITLGQFKQLISKRGTFRYFFKAPSDEFDSGVVHEEIQSDNQILPLWEGKIVGKVEKKE